MACTLSTQRRRRTQTDAIDALGIARFAAQKRPPATRLPDRATEELRELVRFRDRLVQDFGDRLRQLHRHKVGDELAQVLLHAAARSVGRHHGEAYRIQIRFICDDLDVLRRRLRSLEGDIERLLNDHEVGSLLTTIDGIGPQTAARLVATVGDFSGFRGGAAVAAYVGAIPALRQSGKRLPVRAPATPIGDAHLRAKLWMPVLTAVRKNPWLRSYCEALIAPGKLPKVALMAAMRKLLHAVYSVATHRRPFLPRPVGEGARP